MLRYSYLCGFLFFCLFSNLYAQNEEETFLDNVTISGYLETYFMFDASQPPGNELPDFFYNFNRHQEFNLNVGILKAAYESERVRANFALMAGTFTQANMAHEPAGLRNIFEANVGYQLAKEKNLWIDVGVFESHIGFESAIGADCWNMTRSIKAENSPYYLSGAKVTYITDDERWLMSGMLLNGWQRIQRVQGSKVPSFGHQVQFRPNENTIFNSSSFIGTEYPDINRRMRYYHNFWMQIDISERFGLIAGFDYGLEQIQKRSSTLRNWYSPIFNVRYKLSDKLAVAMRYEYFNDRSNIALNTSPQNGFIHHGASINLDVNLHENVLFRVEARSLESDRLHYGFIFGDPILRSYFFGTSLSARF